MDSIFKNCQSCGMPLKKSPNGGGTNADKSVSTMYCAHCYDGGNFTQPNWTAKQMQELAQKKMKEMGFPSFMARLFTKGIPKLKRWKNV